MEPRDWSQVSEMVEEACTRLFADFGVNLGAVAAGSSLEDAEHAVIGFTGDQMRGVLMLSASHAILQASHPAPPPAGVIEEEDLRDWNGELANQLLGRVKKVLLGHGIVINVSTPTTLSGSDLRIGSTRATPLRAQQSFARDAHGVQVRLEAVAEGDVALSAVAVPLEGQASEGDVIEF